MHEFEAHKSEIVTLKGEEIPAVNMALRVIANQIIGDLMALHVNEDDKPFFKRDVQIYLKHLQDPNQKFINLHILGPNLVPVAYAFSYPYGVPSWQPN